MRNKEQSFDHNSICLYFSLLPFISVFCGFFLIWKCSKYGLTAVVVLDIIVAGRLLNCFEHLQKFWIGEQRNIPMRRQVSAKELLRDICIILSYAVLYVCSRDLMSVLPKTAGMEGEAMPKVTSSISTSQLLLDRCGRSRSQLSETNTFSIRRLGTGTTRIRGSTT